MVPRVLLTEKAAGPDRAAEGRHGPLMFHQSGGCCDGSAPMCFAAGEFRVGAQDVLLGEIAGCRSTSAPPSSNTGATPISSSTSCRGAAPAFRSRRPKGVRFLTRSRVFTDD